MKPPSKQWPFESIIARSVLSDVGKRTSEAEQLLKTGDAFFEPAATTILKFDNGSAQEPAEIVCFYLTDKTETPPIKMLPGGLNQQTGKAP